MFLSEALGYLEHHLSWTSTAVEDGLECPGGNDYRYPHYRHCYHYSRMIVLKNRLAGSALLDEFVIELVIEVYFDLSDVEDDILKMALRYL